MARYAVYFRQINQARIEVEASDRNMARAIAVKAWYDEEAHASIMGVEELPNTNKEGIE